MKCLPQLYMSISNKRILSQESQTGFQSSMNSTFIIIQKQKNIYFIQSHIECIG